MAETVHSTNGVTYSTKELLSSLHDKMDSLTADVRGLDVRMAVQEALLKERAASADQVEGLKRWAVGIAVSGLLSLASIALTIYKMLP